MYGKETEHRGAWKRVLAAEWAKEKKKENRGRPDFPSFSFPPLWQLEDTN